MKRLTTEEFVARARKIHGDRFSYDRVVYGNYDTPVSIGCLVHGAFSQTPDNHLAGKGCRKCAGNQRRTAQEILRLFKSIYGQQYQYDLSTFANTKQRLHIVCRLHGPFAVSYYKHLKGAGCPRCTEHYQHQASKHFVRRARAIHGRKYQYGKYLAAAKKMRIVCPAHGVFWQSPASHLQGHGCRGCANDRKRLLAKGGYSAAFFVLHPEMRRRPATLYLVEFRRPGEIFLKVGVTRTSLRSRMKSGYTKYSWRPLVSKALPLYQAFRLEQKLLLKFKSFRIFPRQNKFVGKTECLSDCCTGEVLSWVQKAVAHNL